MQNKINRVLSLVLVVIMVLSMIPAAFAEEDSGSAAYAAENTTTGEQYADISDAIAEAQAGQTVKALADAQEVAYGNEGVILDLNGHDLTVTAAEGVTVSAIDSATDDYEGPYGTLTTEGKVATTVKTSGDIKSYVTIAENGSYSFHRYYASIAAISLKPAQAALGYRAEFRGDEAVKNAVVSYGYELWVNNNAHKTYTRTDALESGSLTLRLKNILAEGNDALNALGSTATIGGNAYIALDLGGEQVKLQGTEQLTTLRQVVESINANVSAYGEAQLQSVRDMITTYAAWMEGWNTDAIFGKGEGEGDDSGLDVEITVDVTVQDGVLAEDAVLSSDDITVTVPQGTVLEEGTTQLVLTIAQKASSDSGIAEEEGYSLLPLDVHIEGISANNTTPIIVCLGEVLPKALNIGNYDLFHVEDGKTVPMTRVHTISELDAHNEFYYDPATGAVTVAMASFSEVALRNTAAQWTGAADHTWYDADATTLYIYNADQLWSFSQIVGGMNGQTQDSFAGKTVVLHADLDLNDLDSENSRVFYPIGYWNSTESYNKVSGGSVSSGFYTFEGTFDGNGHTISNFYQNTWEMFGDYNDGYAGTPNHYRDGMGLFGKVYGGTVKNLTVESFSSDGEFTTTGTIAAYADCGAQFENIAIFDCNPRVYNIGNGGIVGCVGWYAVDAVDTPVTFTNITVDNSNKISALWGSWDVACGGLVGQYYPTSGQSSADYPANAGISMVNCHVAAQIDVYNDVCANYQYYAYRYAGMLIGSVRENVTIDGREYPKMDGLSAENCTVHFGDWNDYYYCELVANSLASYTHDHQMSRLEQVADVNGTTITYLDGTIGTVPASGRYNYVVVKQQDANGKWIHGDGDAYAECYHFVDGAVWNHADAGTETVDGVEGVLKEDKQHIYREFDQLVTGYGWGVTSKGIGEMDGVTILDREVADSVVKFDKAVADGTTYWTGAEVTIGDLFTENSEIPDILAINSENVQVSVSPVGATSTAGAMYTANTDDWTEGTLTFSGKGAAEIIITDYYYCIETRLEVYVDGYTVRYNDPSGIKTVVYGENGITELPDGAAVEGKEFYGWATEPVEDKSESASVISAPYTPSNKDSFFLHAVYTYTEQTSFATTTEYVLTALTDISATDIVVIVGNNGNNYAMSNNKGTGSAPSAVSVTVTNNNITSTVINDVLWNISKTGDGYIIYPNGTTATWLYCTSSNNGVRVGTNDANTFVIDAASGYLKHNGTNRYLGIYNSQDWRCYTTGSNHANIGNQTFSFYVKKDITVGGNEQTYYVSYPTVCAHENQITDSQAATCTTAGYTTVTCADCGIEISHEEFPIIEHIYENGSCTMCGKEQSDYSQVSTLAEVTNGDYVIAVNVNGNYYALGTAINDKNKVPPVAIEVSNSSVESEAPVWTLSVSGTNVSLYNGTTYLVPPSGDSTDLKTSGTASTWTIAEATDAGTFTIKSSANSYKRGILYSIENNANVFGHYANTNNGNGKYYGNLYLFKAGSVVGCTHENATTVTTDATCTEEGSIVTTCPDCGHVESETIKKLPHNFVDGNCSVCGEAQVIIPEIPETGVYQLVTDINDITAGGKFVIVATANGQNYAMGTYDSEKSAVLGEEVEISGNYVTTADAHTWIIGKYGENIALQGTNGAYLKQSSTDGAQLSDSKSEAYAWTVLAGNNTNTFHIVSANEQARGLVYRTGAYNYFRSFKQLDNATGNEYFPDLKLYKLVESEIAECEHANTTTTSTATCTEAGVETETCDDCGEVIGTTNVEAIGHTTDNGVCDNCGETIGGSTEPTLVATFALGADGSADKSNSTTAEAYSDTQSGYTLSISNGLKMYPNCTDGVGNGCIKIGSGSATGGFTIAVPDEITQVVIYIAKYKTDAGTIKINNGDVQTISTSSSDGEYTAITIDTTSNKTITVATTSKRAMINTIEFWKP